MNGIVGAIEAFVQERLVTAWPDLAPVRVEARPLLDLTRGDFGIDCCLAVGAALKRRPEEVAREFVSAFPIHAEYSFDAVDGFINVTLRKPERLGLEDRTVPRIGAESHRIIVSPPISAVSENGFVRLLGSAVIQTALIRSWGGRSELFVGAERCEGAAVADLFRAGLDLGSPCEPSVVRRGIESHVMAGAFERTTVWIPPNFLGRGEFRDFYRRCFAEQPRVTLRCPPRVWCEGFQESWWEIARRGREVAALALMVASSRAPEALDEHALTLAEQGNLRWYLESTHRRLERLMGGVTNELAPEPAELPAVVRRVAIRSATVYSFERGAALRGEVSEWIDALTDLLRSVNLWMNAPEIRRALEAGGLSPVEGEILSGAGKAVSDIMLRNPLFYEVDRA